MNYSSEQNCKRWCHLYQSCSESFMSDVISFYAPSCQGLRNKTSEHFDRLANFIVEKCIQYKYDGKNLSNKITELLETYEKPTSHNRAPIAQAECEYILAKSRECFDKEYRKHSKKLPHPREKVRSKEMKSCGQQTHAGEMEKRGVKTKNESQEREDDSCGRALSVIGVENIKRTSKDWIWETIPSSESSLSTSCVKTKPLKMKMYCGSRCQLLKSNVEKIHRGQEVFPLRPCQNRLRVLRHPLLCRKPKFNTKSLSTKNAKLNTRCLSRKNTKLTTDRRKKKISAKDSERNTVTVYTNTLVVPGKYFQ